MSHKVEFQDAQGNVAYEIKNFENFVDQKGFFTWLIHHMLAIWNQLNKEKELLTKGIPLIIASNQTAYKSDFLGELLLKILIIKQNI